MNPDDLKLENELDGALDNAKFGMPGNEEIKTLLQAAQVFALATEQSAAHASLNKLIANLPNPQNMTQQNPKEKISIFTKIANAIAGKVAPLTLIKTGSGLLVLVLIIYGVSSFVINQLVNATSSGSGYAQNAGSPMQTAGSNAGSAPAMGEATGLSGPMPSFTERAAALLQGKSYYDATTEMAVRPTIAPDQSYPVPPDYYGQNDVRDTREYLKTSYAASLQSVKAASLAERAVITIRGFGGRVDSSQISEENSYVGFVIPKSNVELFRTELKTFVGAKFINENISSQNLLTQKQNIEANTDQSSNSLEKLNAEKKSLTQKHNATLLSLNQLLSRQNTEAIELDKQLALGRFASEEERAAAEARAAELKRLIDNTYAKIYQEGVVYKRELASLNNQIAYYNDNLKNLAKQDVDLTANVETVQGYLTFQKITAFQMLNKYCNGYLPLLTVIAFFAIVYLVARRNGPKPEVQPVQ